MSASGKLESSQQMLLEPCRSESFPYQIIIFVAKCEGTFFELQSGQAA
jgi:hypothetical protein